MSLLKKPSIQDYTKSSLTFSMIIFLLGSVIKCDVELKQLQQHEHERVFTYPVVHTKTSRFESEFECLY